VTRAALPPYVIAAFDGRRHERTGFSSGNVGLDRYLVHQIGQDTRRRITAAFVAFVPGGTRIAGYYTLSALSVAVGDLPAAIAKKLPRRQGIPVTLLGRLGVDRGHRGRGLGELLLMNALARSLDGSQNIASMAVVVDAIDESARAFYEHFEFQPFRDQRRRLFLPMQAVASILSYSNALNPRRA
jgi:GNAT superfamily N-acetyltransferase